MSASYDHGTAGNKWTWKWKKRRQEEWTVARAHQISKRWTCTIFLFSSYVDVLWLN